MFKIQNHYDPDVSRKHALNIKVGFVMYLLPQKKAKLGKNRNNIYENFSKNPNLPSKFGKQPLLFGIFSKEINFFEFFR